MYYEELYRESNEVAVERFELVMERIASIAECTDVPAQYDSYFKKTAKFLLAVANILAKKENGSLADRSMEECKADNMAMYYDVLQENYAACFFKQMPA